MNLYKLCIKSKKSQKFFKERIINIKNHTPKPLSYIGIRLLTLCQLLGGTSIFIHSCLVSLNIQGEEWEKIINPIKAR